MKMTRRIVIRGGEIRIDKGVPMSYLRLGHIGKADAAEFHRMVNGVWIETR